MISPDVLIITLGSFVAAVVNAAFATGGIYVLLFTSVSVLPLSAAVPLQTAFSAASLMSRIHLFWPHIHWRIVRVFVVGCLFGVYFGTRTFASIPEETLALLMGCVLLTLIWMPAFNRPLPLRHPFFFVGVIHSYLGALFGVGGVLQPAVLRTEMVKLQITGTLAACMLSLDVMKSLGYTGFGFSYADYIPHIIGASVAGYAGSLVGKRVTAYVSEAAFRVVFRALVTLVALRLIYRGVIG